MESLINALHILDGQNSSPTD